MPKVIKAIYKDGVFKPLEKVELKEGERVRIRIDVSRKERRIKFIREWRPITLKRKITGREIEKLRLERYESIP